MKKILLMAFGFGLASLALAAQDRFVAHEWGTFTSVQGADGIQIEWNPFVPAELPKFVYGQPHRRTGLLKSEMIARQRMETPVIYFYSETPRTVDVTVNFPEGKVTEWYPQIANPKSGGKTMQWKDLQILAHPKITLPRDTSSSHYYAARDTTANLVQTKGETEKFIFYRGVASFTAPLRVLVGGANEDVLYLQSAGAEALKHFYVIQIRNGSAKYHYVEGILPGQGTNVRLEPGVATVPLSDFQNNICQALRADLEKEGLYPPEAAAMVKTWNDSWFAEDGIRILYVLPRTWTDRTLPLSIEPKPDEIERVMVGRAEVILPSQEWRLLKEIVRYSETAPEQRAAIIDETKSLGLGRFADAAVRRLLGTSPSKDFNAAAWALVEATNGPWLSKSLVSR
ncbi:MAG TPA: hypothetical protein VJ063_19715 [Verrucomicrobiae bacterium]|nr:hypothetical protein [Verrucomicrobiae bacterium]